MTSKHDALRARFSDSVASDDDSSFQRAGLTGWLERRTCRRYSSQSVPQALLDALLDVALCASSKSDYQQCSVIDVRDPMRRREVAEEWTERVIASHADREGRLRVVHR